MLTIDNICTPKWEKRAQTNADWNNADYTIRDVMFKVSFDILILMIDEMSRILGGI